MAGVEGPWDLLHLGTTCVQSPWDFTFLHLATSVLLHLATSVAIQAVQRGSDLRVHWLLTVPQG